jgi:TatD DNase family protein
MSSLELVSLQALLEKVKVEELYPKEAAGASTPYSLFLLTAESALSGIHCSSLTISPPSCLLALLHWRTLANLLIQLGEQGREDFIRLEFLPLPHGYHPSHLFVDTHFHLDKLYQRGLSVNIYDKGHCTLYSGVANYVFDTQWKHLHRQMATHAKMYFSVGVHPRIVSEDNASFEEFLTDSRCVAIGEIGIDMVDPCTCDPSCPALECAKDRQGDYLRSVLPLARTYNKTVIFHCRDGNGQSASPIVMKILRDLNLTDLHIHIHCFNGSTSTLREWLGMGPNVFIGLGPLLFRNEYLRGVCREIPSDRFVLESDAPYLGKTPKVVFPKLLNTVSQVLQLPIHVINYANIRNAARLYQVPFM